MFVSRQSTTLINFEFSQDFSGGFKKSNKSLHPFVNLKIFKVDFLLSELLQSLRRQQNILVGSSHGNCNRTKTSNTFLQHSDEPAVATESERSGQLWLKSAEVAAARYSGSVAAPAGLVQS